MNKNFLKMEDFKKMLIEIQENVNVDKLTMIALDIDNSKELLGDEITEDNMDVIIEGFSINFSNFIFSQYGRDSFVAFSTKDISVFNLAKNKDDLQKFLTDRFNKSITFCMGVGVYPDNCKNIEEILSIAFESLFSAKKEAFNTINMNSETPMKLKSLYFRVGQLTQLEHYSKKIKKSESLIIREALDEYLQKKFF
ncbi:hypothetical protein D0U04_30440 [Bacillus clarus]|uniref:GGDEF domain-containing protein n=1 Tax=Bacillus clarus TaxID=2338372 RepID=A0A090ZCD2_9BACI|nr:hypothetical protein [Bacillus clarus]KFN01946.1 hypothetical protein DJ93_3487 [Bacillus clarus]RFT61377.1 hypothetical protein D0U04_30440 [Bacillus clarus]